MVGDEESRESLLNLAQHFTDAYGHFYNAGFALILKGYAGLEDFKRKYREYLVAIHRVYGNPSPLRDVEKLAETLRDAEQSYKIWLSNIDPMPDDGDVDVSYDPVVDGWDDLQRRRMDAIDAEVDELWRLDPDDYSERLSRLWDEFNAETIRLVQRSIERAHKKLQAEIRKVNRCTSDDRDIPRDRQSES